MSMTTRCVRIMGWMLLGLALSACNNEQSSAQPEVLRPVRTQVVAAPSAVTGREFTAVVDAAQKADLGFRVAGKLQRLLVKEGDQVTAGQVIAQLDQTDFKIRLNSRRAEFERAESDFERAGRLVAQGHISRSDYDKIKAQYNTARAQLEAAEQDLKYTTLTAPFAGYIAQRHVENFEEVGVKETIVTLQDISSLTIKIDVPETVMINIDPDDDTRLIYAQFEAIEGKRFPLTLKEASTQADEKTRTYQVAFTMPAPRDHLVLPGMTATVVAEYQTTEAAPLYLPAHAVLEDRGGRFVYTVAAAAAGQGIVQRRAVTVGQLTPQGMQILSGLEVGDRVVIAGMSKMRENLRVRLPEEAQP